ncbi:hypothetical protein [Halobacillus aidingensis]|uniref:Uncharacterized protein n=1 Tax=Halobacillus aidingensis TaxID=240303 RepID=A0A1H0UAK3_HALAD|nr:hypothetical protein [Halobacillus aidingensis]SDP63203.1 hypothetical protein SAMN05421677_12513 [Halobacillus aidingensis]
MDNFYAIEKRLEEIKSSYDHIYSTPIPSYTRKELNFKKLAFWKTERTPACCAPCC